MPNLDVSFTFTPALVLTAIVFDAGLVMLGVAVVRHMREQRRPASDAHLARILPLTRVYPRD